MATNILQPGQSPKSQQLQQLAGSMPVANQAVAQGLQQGRQTMLQQQIGALQSGQAPTPQAIQQMGAQQAGQAAGINLAAQQQTMEQQAKLAQMGQAQTGMEAQKELGERNIATAQRSRALANQLAQVDRNLKTKLFDEQLSFQKDELGRTLFNERQLADYKLRNAKSDEEFRNYEQRTRQLSNRRLKMLEMAQKKILQALSQKFTSREQELTQEQKKRLLQAANSLQAKMAREKARQANRAGMFQAGGTIAGAAAGTYFGGPAGGAAGATAGGAAGSILSSLG